MSRFPLLRLPFLALTNVIKNIDIKDYSSLIASSSRMKKTVKMSRVRIELEATYCGIDYKKVGEPGTKRVCWKQEKWGTEVLDFLNETFIVDSVSMNATIRAARHCLPFAEHVRNLGLKFNKVLAYCDFKHGDALPLLAHCANASELTADAIACSASFNFERFHEFSMNFFHLSLFEHVEWFTVEHLFALRNCSHVKIENVNFSDSDLNKFLKYWMSDKDGRLRTVELFSHINRLWDIPAVLSGIHWRELKVEEKFVTRVGFTDNWITLNLV